MRGLLDSICLGITDDPLKRQQLHDKIRKRNQRERLKDSEENKRSEIVAEYEKSVPPLTNELNAQLLLINAEIERTGKATKTPETMQSYAAKVRQSIALSESNQREDIQKQRLLNHQRIERESLFKTELASRTRESENASSFFVQRRCEFKNIVESTDRGWAVPPRTETHESMDDCDIPIACAKTI